METFSARISLEFAAAENASASSGVAPMPEWADISREQQNMILKLDLAVNQSSVLVSPRQTGASETAAQTTAKPQYRHRVLGIKTLRALPNEPGFIWQLPSRLHYVVWCPGGQTKVPT
jgi:hypothetical protein